MKRLLIVVDYQVDFVTGALANADAAKLEPFLKKAVDTFLSQDDFVLFTLDTHPNTYLQTREGQFLPIPHCISGSFGHHLYGSLAFYETFSHTHLQLFEKNLFASFGLISTIQTLCTDIPDEIILCGVATDICVIANSILVHSAFPETPISIYSDLCAGTSLEKHKQTLSILNGMGYAIKQFSNPCE